MIANEPFVNITGTAQMYSQIAGVLAGFAFTALLGFLRNGASEEDPDGGVTANYTLRSVAVVLFSTITALIISAILYGILAGGQPASGTAFSTVFIDGPAFSLAILGMFYAIGLAASPYSHMDAMLAAVRILMGVVGPAVSMLLISTAVLDIYHFKCKFTQLHNTCNDGAQFLPTRPYGLGVWLTFFGIVGSIMLCVYFRNPPSKRPPEIPAVISCIVFSTSVAAVLGVVAMTSAPAEYVLPDWLLRAALVVVFILVYTISILTMWSCHPPTPAGVKPSPSVLVDTVEEDASSRQGEGVSRSEIASRYGSYLTSHYLDLHVTVVSVALGVAGLAAASLLAGTADLHGWAFVYWMMWLASLLAVATAYAGTMTGAIGLPARIPSMSDLLIPLLMAVVEVLMFGVLVSQIIGFDSRRSVIVAWFFLLSIFGLIAVAAILRANSYFHPSAYAFDIVDTVIAYRRRLRLDATGASVVTALGIAGGLVNLLRSDVSMVASAVLASIVVGGLVAALIGHNQTAQLWRRTLAAPPSRSSPS
ncbi:hypothetical protein [Kribbella monticola]|uniref:hypothetical protein n=1 Tax=Kribbella monticola TaxID=2185285 RepID=UPI0013007288|nr:hypothetical protein [Kribbella monticola]